MFISFYGHTIISSSTTKFHFHLKVPFEKKTKQRRSKKTHDESQEKTKADSNQENNHEN